MLIGISGHIGSGKDTVAKMIQYLDLVNKYPNTIGKWSYLAWCNGIEKQGHTWTGEWEIKKFAGKLKQICSLLTGIPVADFELQSVKDSYLGPEWDIPVRSVAIGSKAYCGEGQYFQAAKSGTTKFIMQRMKVRELLQLMGTDAMRNHVHPNIHINALFADYREIFPPQQYRYRDLATLEEFTSDAALRGRRGFECLGSVDKQYPNWIISDLRFPNEAEAIKQRGGICIRVNRWLEDLDKTGTRHESETALDNYQFDHVIDNVGSLKDLLNQVRTVLLDLKIITT